MSLLNISNKQVNEPSLFKRLKDLCSGNDVVHYEPKNRVSCTGYTSCYINIHMFYICIFIEKKQNTVKQVAVLRSLRYIPSKVQEQNVF